MIRHVIFDMGNVLIRFNYEMFLQKAGAPREDWELLIRQVFRSLEWVRMDRGSMAEEEAVQSVCSRLPERLHDIARRLICHWDRPIEPMPGMEELVKELKEDGYGLYLLSNASFRQHEYWPRIPGSEYFDGTFISCDHRIVKPQPEIYQKMLATFGLKPGECVFIDDVPANIEGAFECGIPGIIFHGDSQALRAALRALGVGILS